MDRPPDKSNTAPVVNEFSGDTAQTIISAASSTFRNRPRGIFGKHVIDMLLGHLIENPGPGGGGCYAIMG